MQGSARPTVPSATSQDNEMEEEDEEEEDNDSKEMIQTHADVPVKAENLTQKSLELAPSKDPELESDSIKDTASCADAEQGNGDSQGGVTNTNPISHLLPSREPQRVCGPVKPPIGMIKGELWSNTATPVCDPAPYKGVKIHGSWVTAAWHRHYVTSSCPFLSIPSSTQKYAVDLNSNIDDDVPWCKVDSGIDSDMPLCQTAVRVSRHACMLQSVTPVLFPWATTDEQNTVSQADYIDSNHPVVTERTKITSW